MKITKAHLRRIIKEELSEVGDLGAAIGGAMGGLPPAVDAEINAEPRPEQHPKVVKSVIVNRLKEAREQIERVSSKVTNEMWRSAVDEAKEEVFPESGGEEL